jgi:hypothetical protein
VRIIAFSLLAGLVLTACGDGPDSDRAAPPAGTAMPEIGAMLERPVSNPFCSFSAVAADNGETRRDGYIFATSVGENAYHGYAQLDGTVEKLTEVESNFGAGMETRRFVDEDESLELELILLDDGMTEMSGQHTGSLRVIHPEEGPAVRLAGDCKLAEDRS